MKVKILNGILIYCSKFLRIYNLKIILLFLLASVASQVQSSSKQIEIKNLSTFVEDFVQKNSTLRVKNSKNLFKKLIRKPKNGRLPESIYKSLGYRLRDPFVAIPPELSTHLYQTDKTSKLYFEVLHDLEKTWSLLNSTQERVKGETIWIDSIVKNNITLDAIDVWYRMAHKNQYKTWINETKKALIKEGGNLAFNKDEFSEVEYGRVNIQLLESLADNTLMSQYLDAESAYLFVRTDSRELPESTLNKTKYNFNQKLFCQANAIKMQVGNMYLNEKFPQLMKALRNDGVGSKVWRLMEVVKTLSKKLLNTPDDKQLQAANYVLSDTVLSMILSLNQKRLNAFNQNVSNFFVKKNQRISPTTDLQKMIEYIDFQNEILNLMLNDYFIGNERVATASLALFRGCIEGAQLQVNVEKIIKIAEGNHFFEGLNFPQSITVKTQITELNQRWDGKGLMSRSSFLAQEEKNRQTDITRKAEQAKKVEKTK